MDDLDAEVAREGLHHLLALVEAQQAVVDEHAGELVADGLVQQRRDHGGIDAARQAEDHLIVADLRLDLGNGLLDVVGHVPVAAAAADVAHEAREDLAALERVRDLGVELHGVELARLVGHRGDRRGLVAADDLEAGRQLGHLVAVRHPDFEQAVALGIDAILDAVEQLGVAVGAHLGEAELALARTLDLAAQLLRHGLHAVADAQHRHAELEDDLRRLPVLGLVHRVRPARQDDASRGEVADELFRHIEGMQFAIDLLLAHAARDQLRHLGTEIEDEYFLVGHDGVSQ